MAAPQIAAFVMAGGEGSRLRPLTEHVPKPALPFAGRCRIIDFALSSLRHSGIAPIFVLLQYRPAPLLEHLHRHWPGVVPLLPALAYAGTADAVRQDLGRLDGLDIGAVAVFAADHVYRMDVRQMADFHARRRADATIAALPVPLEQASEFGVLDVDARGRVVGFQEKPAHPATAPGDPACALVSMGNYLFAPDALRRALTGAGCEGEHDFGRHVLPRLVRGGHVHAYDFRANRVPGTSASEERAYWRDVGTVGAYRAAEDDVRGPRPRFTIDDPAWPVRPTLAVARLPERLHECAC